MSNKKQILFEIQEIRKNRAASEDLDQKRMMIEKELEKKQREASEDDTI